MKRHPNIFSGRMPALLLPLCIFLLSGSPSSEGAKGPFDHWTDHIPEATRFEEGEGTTANPWRIATAEQLALLAREINEGNPLYTRGCYRLTRDIDLGAHYWIPIGRDNVRYLQLISDTAQPFRGTFDGGGRTISGLTYREGAQVHVGLFGFVAGATIRNVVLKDALVDATYGALTAGLVAGKMLGGTLENCTAHGELRIEDDEEVPDKIEDIQSIGGILGRNFGGTIIGCANNARIDLRGARARFLNTGGVVGANSDGLIRNCLNIAPLTGGLATYNHVGGIAGFNDRGRILDSINRGAVDENAAPFRSIHVSVGGVAGENDGTVSGSANEASVYGEWAEEASNTGGIAGWNLGTIEKCTNRGNVTTWRDDALPADYIRTGGIAGWNSGRASVADCVNSGTVVGGPDRKEVEGEGPGAGTERLTSTGGIVRDFHESEGSGGEHSHTGGIAGENARGTITECYSLTYPAPPAPSGVGAIAGDNRGRVGGCYWLWLPGNPMRGIGSGIVGGTYPLDRAAFALTESFRAGGPGLRAIGTAGSPWFYPAFDTTRPRQKHFYLPENGETPRVLFCPPNVVFDYGRPSERTVYPAFADGEIEVTGISPTPDSGLSRSSSAGKEIVLRYDGEGIAEKQVVVTCNLYYDGRGTPVRTFTATLPVFVLNAPTPAETGYFPILCAAAAILVLLMLAAVLAWNCRVALRSPNGDDERDVYP